MELLESTRVTIPKLFFIEDRKEIKKVPVGVPYIFGDPSIKEHIIRIMEYEVLYQAALRSGYPFNFKKILRDNGFGDLQNFAYQKTVYMDYSTNGNKDDYDYDDVDVEFDPSKRLDANGLRLRDYIKDNAAYVDISKLKELKVFPTWVEKIEEAVHTNIHNFATFNPNMYNKKLDGMYGGMELASPNKNLIIIDISASIPKAVGSTCLTMSKNLAESFYADVLITGAQSILIEYENLYSLNVDEAYSLYGNNNECTMFRAIVTQDVKHYKTAIVFGDNHSPCDNWRTNGYSPSISRSDAQKLCKWKVDKVISFHTTSNNKLAGYADFFSPQDVEHISDWVKYL